VKLETQTSISNNFARSNKVHLQYQNIPCNSAINVATTNVIKPGLHDSRFTFSEWFNKNARSDPKGNITYCSDIPFFFYKKNRSIALLFIIRFFHCSNFSKFIKFINKSIFRKKSIQNKKVPLIQKDKINEKRDKQIFIKKLIIRYKIYYV